MRVELIKKIKETGDSFSFIFKPEKEISWEAGQFIFYKIPHQNPDKRGVERHFTISSAPNEKDIMLTSKFDFKKGSSFKKALYNLRPGSSVEVFDVRGNFSIKNPDKKFVFIAGGIGITPYRSMLLDLVDKGFSPDVTLLYGNKDRDIIFKDILDSLESENDWLDINYIIEPQFINEEVIRGNVSEIHDRIYYISGPPRMVKIVKNILLEMNITEKNILADYFIGYGD
jgi:glycine betaine catabolism B